MRSNTNKTAFLLGAICGGTILPMVAHAQLSFLLNDTTPGGMDSQALAGFQTAADAWSSLLVDPVTVRLDIGFEPLAAGVLGSTGSTVLYTSFSTVRNQLMADASSSFDASAVTSLPTGSSFNFLLNDASGSPYLDANGSTNNSQVAFTQANAMALGFGPLTSSDGTIRFSNSFSWDFDASDGVTTGSFDFVGVAAHEIGHALGFFSGVDVVDTNTGDGSGSLNLDTYELGTILDLFRYSTDSLAAGADVRDLSYSYDPYFSIDGGATVLGDFSTGRINGDDNQASHWQDDLSLGLMDPTLAYGEEAFITGLDLIAFDVMGWDLNPAILVPEPGTVMPFMLLVLVASLRRRRL